MSDTPAKALPVRIPADMVARIDALKDPLIPQAAHVRHLLEQALKAAERKAGPGDDSPPVLRHRHPAEATRADGSPRLPRQVP